MADLQDQNAAADANFAEKLKKIGDGFKIVSMSMKNAGTGKVLWTCDSWDMTEGVEKAVRFPKEVLECEEISREMVFSSDEEIKDFRLLQKISLNGMEIEQLNFKFGFVIPKSQNSWD